VFICVTTNCEQSSCELLRFYTRPIFHTLSASGTSRKKWNFQKCTFLWKFYGTFLEVSSVVYSRSLK
jgi:hypothetical protein